jgi:hypothetical protein
MCERQTDSSSAQTFCGDRPDHLVSLLSPLLAFPGRRLSRDDERLCETGEGDHPCRDEPRSAHSFTISSFERQTLLELATSGNQ